MACDDVDEVEHQNRHNIGGDAGAVVAARRLHHFVDDLSSKGDTVVGVHLDEGAVEVSVHVVVVMELRFTVVVVDGPAEERLVDGAPEGDGVSEAHGHEEGDEQDHFHCLIINIRRPEGLFKEERGLEHIT